MDNEIEFWQQSVVPDDGCEALAHKHEGFASHLTKAACELFRLLLEQDRLETTRSDYRALSRVFGYLQLWCDGYGAPSGDLDVVLSESKRLRHDTYRLLVSICNTLADRLPTVLSTGSDDDWQRRLDKQVARTRDLIEEAAFVHGSDDGSDSASDSGSDASSSSNNSTIDNIVKDLETDIHCLVDLGPRYNEPIRDRTVKEQPASPSLTVDWDPAEHLASRIRHRYPNGDTAVTQILGHVNWERAKRLYASREANARAAERPALQLGPVPEAKGTAIASEAKGRVTASGFQDSGLGSTSPSPSLCPETLLSYRDVKGGSIGIPQVPPEGMKGEPFICGICGCSCQLPKASWKSSWKKHVLSDLQPYVCIIPECSFTRIPFLHKTDWVCHLEVDHGFASYSKQMVCPLCQEDMSSWKIRHLSEHLEEVSLTILPANAESEDESDRDLEKGSKDEPKIPNAESAKRPVDSTASSTASESRSRIVNVGDLDHKHDESAWSRGIALYDFTPGLASELALVEGQKLWILRSAEGSADAAWMLASSDRGERQGWVPRAYVRLTENSTAAGDDGTPQAAVASPESPRTSTTSEFHTPWEESHQAEPRVDTGAEMVEQALADKATASQRIGLASEGQAASRVAEMDGGHREGLQDRNPTRPPLPCFAFGCNAAFHTANDLWRHRESLHDYPSGWGCMQPGCSTEKELDQHHAAMHTESSLEIGTKIKVEAGAGEEDENDPFYKRTSRRSGNTKPVLIDLTHDNSD